MVDFTAYQTGAMATGYAAVLWGVAVLGRWIQLGALATTQTAFFGILLIAAWILVPLYWMRVRWSYVIGIIVWAIAMIGLLVAPAPPPWYEFTAPVQDFSFIIFYISGLIGIYFSYMAFQEL